MDNTNKTQLVQSRDHRAKKEKKIINVDEALSSSISPDRVGSSVLLISFRSTWVYKGYIEPIVIVRRSDFNAARGRLVLGFDAYSSSAAIEFDRLSSEGFDSPSCEGC
ncbi:hypothetical protein PGTUg99_028342 [Puccinia graminis f. sp. tritici]|uniref:Uncharacterized protein n=1 Tax=Puccinia graminis f. sp. tritici TaxID=56615 RepID=A0A5B0MZC4_PUCGR|nr:hypothetical protein PGTUg99_028342 [Puccinia graminis f. sp. tritici]